MLTCPGMNYLRATFTSPDAIQTLCQLSSLLNGRRPPRPSFLNHTVANVNASLPGESCPSTFPLFERNLIIIVGATGVGSLLFILFIGLCILVVRAGIESKRTAHTRLGYMIYVGGAVESVIVIVGRITEPVEVGREWDHTACLRERRWEGRESKYVVRCCHAIKEFPPLKTCH